MGNRSSSSPSSSQQPHNAGQSPTTTTDLNRFLHTFNDVSQLRDLINFIEDLLKNASGEKCEGGSSSEVRSYIQYGQTFVEFLDKHIGKLPQEKDSIHDLSAETRKILINFFKDAEKIHWVGAALSVVGFVLTQFNQIIKNRRECLEILKAMVNLGKQIVELNEEMPEQKQKLNEAVECIVVGCCMCTSQLATSKILRFLTASVNADRLKAFQLRVDRLYNLCIGVPLLLEIIGSQLAISTRNANDIGILQMIGEGEKVEEEDITDRMIDSVYNTFLAPVQDAFLDIVSFYSTGYDLSKDVAYIVGDDEFRALERASFVKTNERGFLIAHDIVRARGRKMSEGNRIRDPDTLSECLKDEEKLKNLKGVCLTERSLSHTLVEVNEYHLGCMSNSLRILNYEESEITVTGKCHKPFKQLRCLCLPADLPDLPMEFGKLEHLLSYIGPLTQGMSFYELPRTLRVMGITNIISSERRGVASWEIPSKGSPPSSLVKLIYNFFSLLLWIRNIISSESGVASCCEIPSKDSPPSSLVELTFLYISTMERLPDGLEKLTNLKELSVFGCPKLRELPSKIGELSSLEKIVLYNCPALEEWPSSFGNLSNLKNLILSDCSSKLSEVPNNIREHCKIELKK